MIFDRTVLPSGIRVLTEKMPSVRSATLGYWIGVGSRDEPLELQGSAHFMEHLLFKGTSRLSPGAIAEAFDSVGGEANAFSAKEYTCAYARVLDEDLPMAVQILSEMLTKPALRSDDVSSERRVILEEIAMHEDTPEDLVHDMFAETLFGDHPLGREVMGTVESVKSIDESSLDGFHRANYHPRNIVVAAAGSVDHQQLVDWMQQYFDANERHPASRAPQPPTSSGKLRVATRPTEQTHLIVGGFGYSREHPARFAWGVLDNLLGGGMASRLFQEVRERRGLAYNIYSYRNTYSETGLWAVYAGTAPSNVPDVLKIISDELDNLCDAGITEEELNRAKGHMRGGVVLGLEDPPSRMTRLGKSELVHGEILSVDEILSRIEAVTLEDVGVVARDLLKPESRVLSVIGPFSTEDFADWA